MSLEKGERLWELADIVLAKTPLPLIDPADLPPYYFGELDQAKSDIISKKLKNDPISEINLLSIEYFATEQNVSSSAEFEKLIQLQVKEMFGR